MKLLIVLVFFLVVTAAVAQAADNSCSYTEAAITVHEYTADCVSKPDGRPICRFPLKFSVTSDCRKDLEVFYVCRVSIEYDPGGWFSSPVATSANTIGSVVIHDGAGEGTLKIPWEPIIPAANVKPVQASCYPTEIYPVDEQK